MLTASPSRLLASAGLAAVLLVGACGDDDTGSGTATSADAARSAPSLAPPLTDELADVVDSTVDELGAPGAVVVVTTPAEDR